MVNTEFKAFSKIENIKKLHMTITQKIHGTNAQVYIYDTFDGDNGDSKGYKVIAGSRTRWLTMDDDNYGFANWVFKNQDELIAKLGIGRHYGEWCGLGINNGEGLTHKIFVLFDWWNHQKEDKENEGYVMEDVYTVPVLYRGDFDSDVIDDIMHSLKTEGSRLVPGFMQPEGIVIDINGVRYKKVFQQEDTAWQKNPNASTKPRPEMVDVSHLLQPIRLEKLLSRDERYKRNYPESLRDIAKDYVADLIVDGQMTEDDESVRKSLGKQLFPFLKAEIER